jgi:hypothetical protein
VDTFVIEALPARSFRSLTITFEELLTVVYCEVVLARHIEDFLSLSSP